MYIWISQYLILQQNKKPIKSVFSTFQECNSECQKPIFNFQLLQDSIGHNQRTRRNVTDQDSIQSEHTYFATPTIKMATSSTVGIKACKGF